MHGGKDVASIFSTFCFSLLYEVVVELNVIIIIIIGYCQPDPVQGLRPDAVLTAWATRSSLGVHLSSM